MTAGFAKVLSGKAEATDELFSVQLVTLNNFIQRKEREAKIQVIEHSVGFLFPSPHVAENHGLKGSDLGLLFKLLLFSTGKKERSRDGDNRRQHFIIFAFF